MLIFVILCVFILDKQKNCHKYFTASKDDRLANAGSFELQALKVRFA